MSCPFFPLPFLALCCLRNAAIRRFSRFNEFLPYLHLSDLVENSFLIRVKNPPLSGWRFHLVCRERPPQMQLPDNRRREREVDGAQGSRKRRALCRQARGPPHTCCGQVEGLGWSRVVTGSVLDCLATSTSNRLIFQGPYRVFTGQQLSWFLRFTLEDASSVSSTGKSLGPRALADGFHSTISEHNNVRLAFPSLCSAPSPPRSSTCTHVSPT